MTQFISCNGNRGFVWGERFKLATPRFDYLLEQLNETMAAAEEQSEVAVRFRYRFAIAPQDRQHFS